MAIDFDNRIYILDGGMGTMLQNAGMAPGETSTQFALAHPDILTDIHRQYAEAGSDIIYAATFGMNRFKADEIGRPLCDAVECVVGAARDAARETEEKSGRKVLVALDIGPLGELLEPMGTLRFEDAYEAFAEVVRAGAASGADLVAIETMTDLYEVKAALLAAKENSELPVMVTMTFEENGRTFTGTSLEAMAITLEGLGADAIGINCSLGPAEILPLARELRGLTSLPVIAKPNAGLPDPETGEYDITKEQFVELMERYIECGINIVGGCCGTTPEYIKGIASFCADRNAAEERRQSAVSAESDADGDKRRVKKLKVCSSTDVVTVDHVTVTGERLNPTGKKRLKQALLDGDFDYIMSQAIEQIEAGAEILDVNVGVPSLDEAAVLPEVIKKLQSITGLPLQIDSSNPEAVEAALRVYNGKAIVNSVNGEPEVMERILPVVAKYGAAVIGLTLDGNGIPEAAEERFSIAERIVKKAAEYGIHEEDVIIDCLTLTVSAQQKEANETLRAVEMVKEKLGLSTTLGVSNISFGLPARVIINRTFLAMAMERGLDMPIINPNDEDMMSAIAAFNVLKNVDSNAARYIERCSGYDLEAGRIAKKERDERENSGSEKESGDISYCVEKGIKSGTVEAVKQLLETHDEMTVINEHLIPALDNVGKGFEKGTIFLPQMLQAAAAAQAGFDVIKTKLAESDRESVSLGEVVIATVKGDIHDIGKNIVKVIMENYGYRMIDLGRDVSAERIVEEVRKRNAKLVGLSALMTTTLGSMEETIAAVKAAAPDCRIMVGGAVLTADYAMKIGADFYCADAMKSVEAAQEVFK